MVFFFKFLTAFCIFPVLLCQECDSRLNISPPTYEFWSPNYPKKYEDNMECSWIVSVDESFRIQLLFTAFEFDKGVGNNCNDYLEMWDGGSKLSEKLFQSCAESLDDFKAEFGANAAFNSSGNMLFLLMKTDRKRPRRSGFSATYKSLPEIPSTTDTIFLSTSPDEQSTPSESTVVVKESTTQGHLSATTPTSVTNSSTTLKSILTTTKTSFPTNFVTLVYPSTTSIAPPSVIPSLPSKPPSNSFLRIVIVVPTVAFAILLISVCVAGFVFYRSSKVKSQISPNERSLHGEGKNVTTMTTEQIEPHDTILYHTNESFNASPQDTGPPSYESIDTVDNLTSGQNTRILQSEGVTGENAFGSYDGEEKRNSDFESSKGKITNNAYESYAGDAVVENDDSYASNAGEIANIAYESFGGQMNPENNVNLEEGAETRNAAYESYDEQDNLTNSDDKAIEEVLNVAYESYDRENDMTYDRPTYEFRTVYQAVDDDQSVDDDYSKVI